MSVFGAKRVALNFANAQIAGTESVWIEGKDIIHKTINDQHRIKEYFN